MPPTVQLKTTVVPTSIVRISILGDVLKNFGATDEQIRIAQQGFAERLFNRVTINGLDSSGYIQDQVTLWFDDLMNDANLSVDTSGGRSMIEAVSLKFARGVSYSVGCMRRKGLTISFFYGFTGDAWNDPSKRDATLARFNLSARGDNEGFAPGYGPRQIFSITPGLDNGTHYSHSVARRTY